MKLPVALDKSVLVAVSSVEETTEAGLLLQTSEVAYYVESFGMEVGSIRKGDRVVLRDRCNTTKLKGGKYLIVDHTDIVGLYE